MKTLKSSSFLEFALEKKQKKKVIPFPRGLNGMFGGLEQKTVQVAEVVRWSHRAARELPSVSVLVLSFVFNVFTTLQ